MRDARERQYVRLTHVHGVNMGVCKDTATRQQGCLAMLHISGSIACDCSLHARASGGVPLANQLLVALRTY